MSQEDTDIVPIVLYTVFSVLVLVSNSIVIIVITKSRELHHPTLWNIAVMAAWDLALGLHVLVFIVPSKILNAFAYPDSCGPFSSILMSFLITQNFFNIVVALVDRYISICWPLHYPRLMSAKRFTFEMIIVFLVNVIRTGILSTVGSDGSYSKSLGFYTQEKSTTERAASLGMALVMVVFLVGLLIRIRLELRKKKGTVFTERQQAVSSQFTYTMYVSTIVFIVCYLPTVIALLITSVMKGESGLIQQLGFTFVLSNSLCNVIIYAATYRPFREAFLKLCCPTYFRDQARRELQVHYQRNRVAVSTVE